MATHHELLWVQVIYTFKLKIEDAHLDGTNVFGFFVDLNRIGKFLKLPKGFSEIS